MTIIIKKAALFFLFVSANWLWLTAEVKVANPEGYPGPVPLTGEVSDQPGKMIPRTMYLLESSTPKNRKKVKIAIYGQSLSDENNLWWRSLETALRYAYPYADIEVKSLAVGGFATKLLWRTTYADIAAYYPDLVILSVTGHHTYYENILRFIRGCTTAEVMIQTEQIRGNTGQGEGCSWHADLSDLSDWSNKMSFQFVPGYCKEYGLELVNRRQEWYDYLKANCYEPTSGALLLSDKSHMAVQGQYLTAALTARHFRHDPSADPDPHKMVTIYKIGEDVKIENNSIRLPVSGNRIDIVTANGDGKESVQLLIDGKKPSSYPGCYNNTRALKYNYWNGGIMQTLGTSACLQEEEWTVDIDDDGNFALTGSKTGNDGKGNIQKNFESNSGRIAIHAESWFKGGTELRNRSFTFYTQLYAKDNYLLDASQSNINENAVTLAQGFPNGEHEITLTGAVGKIREVRVYRPPYRLKLDAGRNVLAFGREGGRQEALISSNTYWQIHNRALWLKTDVANNDTGDELSDSKKIVFVAAKNDTGKQRTATVTLTGIGVEPLVLTVTQP